MASSMLEASSIFLWPGARLSVSDWPKESVCEMSNVAKTSCDSFPEMACTVSAHKLVVVQG